MASNDYKLCYVCDNFAWFTRYFEQVTGDDWDDVPYEHNSEPPYEEYDCVMVAYKLAHSLTPDYGHCNSPYSVDLINKGIIPWIRSAPYIQIKTQINAGDSLVSFVNKIHRAGGIVLMSEDDWCIYKQEAIEKKKHEKESNERKI